MANITNEEALALIEPFYNLFSTSKRDWQKAEDSLRDDWVSYYNNDQFRNKQESMGFMRHLASMVPDMEINIKEVVVSGNKIAVRSELMGTPAGDFWGVPHSGKSFSIMTIDINTFEDGKLTKLYHLEDWHSAIAQVKE